LSNAFCANPSWLAFVGIFLKMVMEFASLPNIGNGGVEDVIGDFLPKCCRRRCWWHQSWCRTLEQRVIELSIVK
jgi:hypothetical protein